MEIKRQEIRKNTALVTHQFNLPALSKSKERNNETIKRQGGEGGFRYDRGRDVLHQKRGSIREVPIREKRGDDLSKHREKKKG